MPANPVRIDLNEFRLLFGPPASRGGDQDFEALFGLPSAQEAYAEKVRPRGGRGIDRIGVDAFDLQADDQLAILSRKALSGDYRFAPYLEQLIPRGARRVPRRISVPTLRDRVALHQLKLFLQGPFVDAFERRLPNQFVREIRTFALTADLSKYSVLRSDISTFYDRIEHDLLLAKIRLRVPCQRAVDLVRRAIRNPTLPQLTSRRERKGQRNERGVPQGLAISNLLAGIYLADVDRAMGSAYPLYLRYVDDIVVVAPVGEISSAEQLLRTHLSALRLEINEDKTTRVHALEPFEYLGYRFDLPRVSIRQASVERFLRTVAARFSAYNHRSRSATHPSWLTPEERRNAFIDELNEKITGAISGRHRYGWLFYYSESDDLALLHKADAIIGTMFKRLDDFAGQPLRALKRLSRAHFEMRYSVAGGYILNYDAITSPTKKLEFLVRRGLVDPADAATMTIAQVEARFTRERERRLSELERDVGMLY